MKNSLSKILARKLLELYERDLPIGKFRAKADKELINVLRAEGIISLYKYRNTDYVKLVDAEALIQYIHSEFGIHDLEDFVNKEFETRSDAAFYAGDSKTFGKNIINGFYLRAIKPVKLQIDKEIFDLSILKRSALYASEPKDIQLLGDVLVVGIENFETFMRIENYSQFNQMQAVFLWRGNSKKAVEWLNTLSNDYLHFGDFDISGIVIFLTEFYAKLQGNRKISFYLPENIEQLIVKYGSKQLYLNQLDDKRIDKLDLSVSEEVQKLYNLIKKHRKVLEQEILEKF